MSPLDLSGFALPEGAREDLAWQETVFVPAPPANEEVARIVPGGTVEILLAVHVRLVTDSNVADRNAILFYTTRANETIYRVDAVETQPASTTALYIWTLAASGAYSRPAGARSISFVPPVLHLPGHQVFVSVVAMQAGDQIDQVQMTVIRIPTGPAQEGRLSRLARPFRL